MSSPLDDLIDMPGPVGDEMRRQATDAIPPGELPADTEKRKIVQNRFKAEDLAARDIPSFRNASGDVSAVTDETGKALTHFDDKHGIAYDSAGNPKLVSYDSESGPPTLRDPFAGLPSQTDENTGDQYQVRPGLAPNWVGRDEAVASAARQKEADKAVKTERDLLGRQLTLDEAEHKRAQVQHKQLSEDLTGQVTTLLDPKYQDADLPTTLKAIDDHFNQQYAGSDANETGWFNSELTPEAKQIRAGLDQSKAQAYDKAQKLFAMKARGTELADRIDQSRAKATLDNQQLLAHSQGQPGPYDQLAADNAPEPGPKTPEEITGHEMTDLAIMQAKQGQKPYIVDDKDQVQFRPDNLTAGVDAAAKDGLLDPKWAAEHRDKFQEVDKKFADLQKAAGNEQVLKALLHGATIGGAFLAGAAPGAKIGALGAAAIPGVGETGIAEVVGAALGGLATGTVAAFYARKGLQKLSEYNDAVKSLTASAELHPVASGVGELIAFGASAPKALSNLYRLGTVAGEAVSDLGPEAVRAAQMKVVGRQLGIGAVSGAAFEGAIRPAFDAARYAAADAVGIPHDKFKSPDAKSMLTNMALAVLTAGHSIEFHDYTANDVASVLFRARARNDAGIGLSEDNPAGVIKAFQDRGLKVDSQQAESLTKPLTPQEEHLYNSLKEKVDRMQRSGAFDDASGVKFTSGTQARVKTFGKEGAPIASAGVEVIKKGEGGTEAPKELPAGPETPGGNGSQPKGGEPTNETSNNGPVVQNGEGSTVPTAESPAKPANETGKGAQPLSPNATDQTASGRGSESNLLKVVAPEGSTPPAPQTTAPHVIATAVKQNGSVLVGSKWNESHDGILTRHGLESVPEQDRGFLVQQGDQQQFVTRDAAHPIAKAAGQIANGGAGTGTQLRSADLQNVPVQHVTPTDAAAHEAATSPLNEVPQPTLAQKDAGNYKLGHQTISGLDISFENPAGSIRSGQNKNGKPWSVTMPNHYGYIKGTIGKDKDHVDIFVKPGTPDNWTGPVYVVNQKNPTTGKFDEHKAVLGANNIDEARSMYHAAHEVGWKGEHSTVEMSMPEFKDWAYKADKSNPAVQRDTSPATKSERSKVEKLALGAMAKHRETLERLNHGTVPKAGETWTPSGIETQRTEQGGQIVVDSGKLAQATRGMTDRQQSKFIQRAIEEEVVHVAAFKWERSAPGNTIEITEWGSEKDDLDKFMAGSYDGWEKLSDAQKGHEKLRAVLQSRWTGKLTEAAYRVLRSFLKFLRGIYEQLTEGQREIVDRVESILKGEETPRAPPETKAIEPTRDVRTPTDPRMVDAQARAKEKLAKKPKSQLDDATRQAMKEAFDGLFAAMPTKHLAGKEKAAVVMLKKGKTIDEVAKMFVMRPEQVEQAYDKSLSAMEPLGAAVPYKRAYPSYTTANLKASLATANPETRAKMEAEIAARESGLSTVKVTPQTAPLAPRLRGGEKQGDIFSGQTEDLTLAGEAGIDWGARQKATEDAEKAKIEAQKKTDEAQGSLFAAKPKADVQRAIPPEKVGQFMVLAQKLVAAGIDTPEKLANEIESLFGPKGRPFSQAVWDSMVPFKPELRGVYNWPDYYPKPAPRKSSITRSPRPDGGFSEHPFIQAIKGEFGGIMSRTVAKKKLGELFEKNKSLWDDVPRIHDPSHFEHIYDPKSGQTPDVVAQGLADIGMLPHGATETELWREIGKISESSKRIERQQREQAAEEKRAQLDPEQSQEPAIDDPWADILPNTDEGLPEDLRDDTVISDDGSSSPSLESDSEKPKAGEQGGTDSVPARPGAARDDGRSSDDSIRGSQDPATSGPLSADVPSAPHGESGDQQLREPASDAPERAPRSSGPAGSRESGDSGLSPDTERTKIAGENLVLPQDSGSLADRSGSSGEELDIERAAPALTPEQADDVRFIRARLNEQGKPGVLLTNGTGTGKTFSGLGAVKMELNAGAKDILVVVPSDKIGSDWVDTAHHFFGIKDAGQLASTVDDGKGKRLVITTYANFGQNNALVHRPWRMIVTDESHYLSSNENGDSTLALHALRAITWHPQGIYTRVQMLEPEASEGLKTLRKLERRNRGLTTAQKDQRREYQAKIDETTKKVREQLLGKPGGVEWRMEDGKNVRHDTPASPGMKESERPKVIFMSATPFAYRKNVDYGSGYLFDYPPQNTSGAYNTPSPFGQFMIENFGYRMRTGRLTEPENATATGILERRFAERLMREKAMRGRALVVPHDYSREFVLTESQLGKKIDDIINHMMSTARLRTLSKKIGISDYMQRRFLLESLKAREAIPRIKQHLALGRKIVVFHDYKLGGALNPLRPNIPPGSNETITSENGEREVVYHADAFNELKAHFPDWDEVEAQLSGLQSPIAQFTQAFPEGTLGIFNGSVSKKDRRRLVNEFNTSGGKMNVLLAQRASAKEGISLHDRDKLHQRAFIDLGIPGRPTDAIQSEGRIYRHGVQSNAIDEYLVTGTNFERWTFAQTIAQRASTAENLAMGEGARALLQSFSTGFNEATSFEPHAGQGTGGKEADAVRERGNPYDNAVALYYTNEKKTSRSKSREGIDYFPTPEPLGFKMVEWTAIQPGEKFLEPSAGHGAIARFAPDSTNRHAVEPSNELAGRLALNAPDTEIHNQRFEDFNIVNKFDTIAMNSPWGVGGKTAMEHLEKAAKHLKDGGRLVALLPRGKMDQRFNEWLESEAASDLHFRAEILLPQIAFVRAGTSISGRVVVIDKTSDKDTALTGRQHDLSDETDIKKLFDRLEHLSVPARPEKKIIEPEPEAEQEKTPVKATTGYVADPEAERKPLSPEHTLPTATRDSDFTPAEFMHTRDHVPVFVAKTARYMSKLEFATARTKAKELGGYYSNFKGAGAVPGFHFKTAEARDRFIGGTNPNPLPNRDSVLPEQSPALAAAVPKVAEDYYKADVEPVLRSAKATMTEVKDAAVHLFSPTTGVDTRAVDAAFKMLGGRNKAAYVVDRTLVAAEKMFTKMPRAAQVDFIDRVKTGTEQATPELQAIADTMRAIDTGSWKAARAAYRALGFDNDEIPLAWKDNHYRVMWKTIPGSDKERKGVPGGFKSPLRGSRGMQRQSTLADMSEGIEMGGIPFSYNPVTNFKMAQVDIWKLTTALQMWAWGKDNGFVQYVKGKFAKVPDGMTWLNDAISRVYFPTPQGIVEPGRYAVEQGFGRLLNNYLSRDFVRAAQLGRSLLWLKNATTQLELALSLFHGVFETLETVGSNIGLGLSKLVNRGILGGDVKAILDAFKDIITAPTSPISGYGLGGAIRKAAGNPDAFFATDEGKKLLKVFPRAREMIEDLFTGGWKPSELEQDWKNNSIRSFVDAIGDIKSGNSSNYIGAGLRAFPAFNEMLMKPLFDFYIPNLKLAQFFREYDEALKQNERKLSGGVLTRAALARQVWRFVEDRFGELNYDTLFWNNNFKTAMQLMFRSVTWKLGSVEAFAGAFGGQGREFINAMREHRAPELHRNMAWLFGMFLLTATLGTIISKTLGKKDPKDLTDIVFPQIDPKDPHVRVSIPTYFKDMVHLIHSPVGYVTSSMSGWIGRVADLLKNKDYYGVQIRNTDDPMTKQALQVAKYTGETLLPFSVRGYKNLSAAQVDSVRKMLAAVGVTPAPRYIGQSAAERKASDIMKGQQTDEGITPEQFEVRQGKKRLVSEISHGRTPDIAGARRAGELKPREVKELFKRAGMSPLAYSVHHMPLPSAERVYASASPKEKAELAAIMAKKRSGSNARAGRTQFAGF
jgi:hypothetical protein